MTRQTLISRLFSAAAAAYGLALAVVFPLVYRNNYIDINTFKYQFFTGLSGIALLAMAAVLLAGLIASKPASRLAGGRAERIALYSFALVACVSTLLSDYPREALTGELGRRNGLWMILSLVLAYRAALGLGRARTWVFFGFLASATLAALLGICNFFQIDPLGMYRNLMPEHHYLFISTVGNINFFGALIALLLGAAGGAFLTTSKKSLALCPSLLIGFAAFLCARSNSAFLGLLAALGAMFLYSFRSWRTMSRFVQLLGLFALSTTVMQLVFSAYGAQSFGFEHPNELCALVLNARPRPLLPVALFAVSALFMLPKSRDRAPRAFQVVRRVLIGLGAGCALAAAALMGYFTFLHPDIPLSPYLEYFRFSDHWGTFRGFAWTRALRLYADFTPLQKLIGLGPDVLKPYFLEAFRAEMMAVTGGIFDNCHNEYLQYLLTLGALGLAAYLGLLFFSFRRLLRQSRHSPLACGCLCASLAYAAQAFFNINQPCTAPLFFLLLALNFPAPKRPEAHIEPPAPMR